MPMRCVRQSSYTVPEEPVKESEFYAYCWKRGYDGVWFEPMTPNEKESVATKPSLAPS